MILVSLGRLLIISIIENVFCERCTMARLVLSLSKCAFAVNRGILLGQVISKDGMQIDARKVATIQDAPIPKTVKQFSIFVSRQVKWHNRYLRCLPHVPHVC